MAALAARVFGSLVRARELAYASGRLGVARLGAPVVSIGNLSAGGSGKTPTVIALGKALQAAGVRVDVLSRGYRRGRGATSRMVQVAATGNEDAGLVGDEPLVIAARLGAPVFVHADRFRAGLEAEQHVHPQLHLLDDGFQHRQLARAFDLVLLTPRELTDRLLPAGRMREPLTGLRRAQAVLWVGGEVPLPDLSAWTRAPVFAAQKRGVGGQGRRARRPFAFCGLARPESFWETLAESGVEVAGRHAFRDHHRYSADDRHRLEQQARVAGADGWITTAKDAVKLRDWPELEVQEIEMQIPEMDRLTALVRDVCQV